MLHIKNSMNLCSLADDMIKKIIDAWTDPFNPPTVILPDSMTENWFKLHWIQKQNDKPVLMNLKTSRLDSFLFDVLKPEDQKIKHLSVEMLHLKLIKELPSFIVEKCIKEVEDYAYAIESEDIEDLKYCLDGSLINYIRLYDFAKTLANLFLNYEVSRPEWFRPDLFIDIADDDTKWKGWQRELYERICKNGILINGVTYKTIAELYFNNDGLPELKEINKNVFIFGFSGMGQTYRRILKELAVPNDVSFNIYLQTTSENNDLIQKLGGYGKDNLTEWCKPDGKDRKSKQPEETNKNLDYPHVFLNSAPSKIREVEVIHSEICKIIKNEDKTGLSFNDIKVFAPDIKEYIPAINLVFGEPMISEEEVEKRRAKSKTHDESFGIPFSINDFSSSSSFVVEAMKTLVTIEHKRYFSRVDFLSLIKNPVIQASYRISEEDVAEWRDWIDGMNIFRNRTTDKLRDDWTKAKQRLLLSKLTDLGLTIDQEEITPFENSSDNDCITRFVSIIDDLYSWINVTESDEINCSDKNENSEIDTINEVLKKILSMGRHFDETLAGERAVFSKLLGTIGLQKKIFNGQAINKQCLMFSLIDAIKGVSLSQTDVTKGVEFISFKPNRVIPAQYVLFMGLDSKSFPGTDSTNVLDLRGETKNTGDDSIPGKNKNAFLCQLMATSGTFFMSYVNKDLQKDEDFYASTVVNDTISFAKDKLVFTSENEKVFGIDEKAKDNQDLFSFRRLRNYRNLYDKPKEYSEESERQWIKDPKDKAAKAPKKITISQMRRFLEEPFKFKAESAFALDEENEKDDLEFEPIELDNLTLANLRKKLIQNNDADLKESLIEVLEENGTLPDGIYGEKQKEMLKKSVSNIESSISSIMKVETWAKFRNTSLKSFKQYIRQTIIDGVAFNWKTAGSYAYYNEDYLQSGILKCFIAEKDDKGKDFSIPYATALAQIGKDEAAGKTFDVELYIIDNMDLHKANSCSFSLSHDQATKMLDAIIIDNRDCSEKGEPSEKPNLNSQISRIKKYKFGKFFEDNDYKLVNRKGIRNCLSDEKVPLNSSNKEAHYLFKYIEKKYSYDKQFPGSEVQLLIDKKEKDFELLPDFEGTELTSCSRECDCINYDSEMNVSILDNVSIMGRPSFFNANYAETNKLVCIDIKSNTNLKDFLNGYVSSLVLIASSAEIENDREFEVNLHVVTPKSSTKKKLFHITKGQSIEYLESIYKKAFLTDEPQKCLPIEAFYKKELKDNPSIFDLAEFVSGEHGPWGFFKKSKLIDTTDGLGYEFNGSIDFNEQWNKEKKEMKELILPLCPDDETEDSEEEDYE